MLSLEQMNLRKKQNLLQQLIYFQLERIVLGLEILTVPENIQIISGAQQGLDIVSKSVLNYNDVVIVEFVPKTVN